VDQVAVVWPRILLARGEDRCVPGGTAAEKWREKPRPCMARQAPCREGGQTDKTSV